MSTSFKPQRLDTKGVENVMVRGRAYQSSSFLLKTLNNSSKPGFYRAFIAPKKQFPTAVLRNKAKRRMRVCFDVVKKELSPQKGLEIAFIARNVLLKVENMDIVEEMRQVLIKSGILA